jgi:hypothetical protein
LHFTFSKIIGKLVNLSNRCHYNGGQCKTLLESNKIIWSSDVGTIQNEGFDIEKDSTTGLMTVHIGSGEYEFHALWQ